MHASRFRAALVVLTIALAGGADWPMFRSDASRSGYTAENLPTALTARWVYRAAHAPTPAWPTQTRLMFDSAFQPIVAGGILYFGSSADDKLYALDAASGEVVSEHKISTRHDVDVDTGRDLSERFGLLSDVLVGQGESIFMRRRRLLPTDGPQRDARPLRSTGGLLDESWFSRTRWHLGETPWAEYCVFDQKTLYGVAARSGMSANGGFFTPGARGYELFAADRSGGQSGQKNRGRRKRWSLRVPVRVTSMVVAGDTLFASGTPDVIDPSDPWAGYEGRLGGRLLALSAEEGKIRAEYRLDAPPVLDGMAAAAGRLLVSTMYGKVLCYEGEDP